MSLQAVTKAYSETFGSATSWTVNHNLGVTAPAVDIYNGSDVTIIPQSVISVDADTLRIDWSTATAGLVYVV